MECNINRTTFPFEIMELIVDDLASAAHSQTSSLTALRSLALVSVVFCRRAYKHLFSELSLTLINLDVSSDGRSTSKQTLKSLYNLLIQGLQFPRIGMVYFIQAVQISLVFGADRLQDLVSLPELSGILDCLHGTGHGISCFKLDVDTTRPHQTARFPLPISRTTNPRFFKAFVSLCHSSRLMELHLTNIALDSNFLCKTNIQNLHLDNLSLHLPNFSQLVDSEEEEEDQHKDHPHHKSSIQLTSMSLLNIGNSFLRTDIFTYLMTFLYHTPSTYDRPLARAEMFAKLTHLTLQDCDRTTPIHLLPKLRTLKILQKIYLTRRHMLYNTALPQFFVANLLPETGTGRTLRDLGSVENIIIETVLPDSRLFFYSDQEDEPKLQDTWRDIDLHLTKTLIGTSTPMRHVQFNFLLRASQMYMYVNNNNGLPQGQRDGILESYLSLNKSKVMGRFMTKFFPRLSSSEMAPMCSSEVSISWDSDGVDLAKFVDTVKCKSDKTGWW